MLAYIKEQYAQAQAKLTAVRAQCLTLDDSEQAVKTDAQFKARARQLKPFEVSVGLWEGRLHEAVVDALPITSAEEFPLNSEEIINA